MKWPKIALLCLVAVLCLFFTAPVMGAGTVTQAWTSPTLTFNWVGDVSGGAVTAEVSELEFTGYVCLVVTNPGTVAPTDDYDITLTDEDGIDIMGGQLADRDTADSESAVPKIGSVYGCRPIDGTITLNITNQSVNSATGAVKIWILR